MSEGKPEKRASLTRRMSDGFSSSRRMSGEFSRRMSGEFSKRLSGLGSLLFGKPKSKEADVETLRGEKGSNFESTVMIQRGGEHNPCILCLFGDGGKKKKFILIKGTFCFVFDNEKSPSSNYAISLPEMDYKIKNNVVVLESLTTGNVEYEFTFDDNNDDPTKESPNNKVAQEFYDVARQQKIVGKNEEIKKALGHENLLHKRQSVQFAEYVGSNKVDDQPAQPVRSTDVFKEINVATFQTM